MVQALTQVPSRRRVADGFDVVAVRVYDKGPVIIGVVRRAQARRAVVAATLGNSCLVEGINRSSVWGLTSKDGSLR